MLSELSMLCSFTPLQGFKYLYLTPQDYKKVSALNSVHCEHVEDEGESRYPSVFSISWVKIFFVQKWTCQAVAMVEIGGWHMPTRTERTFSHAGTRSRTSLEKMKGWAWRIWKAPAWSLESRPWPTRRSSPWTWWGWSGCARPHASERARIAHGSRELHNQEDLSRAKATASA